MLRTIYWFLYFFISLICLIPNLWKVNKMDKDSESYTQAVERNIKWWFTKLLKIAGVTVTVNGEENLIDSPHVLVANHQGNFDIPILSVYTGSLRGFMAKIETQKIPFIGKWMEHMNCIFLDRSSMKSSAKSMISAINLLKSGKSLVIFPEGTRNKGGEIKEFKEGAFRIAQKAKVAVIPVSINGSYKVMEANGGIIKPHHVTVTIHKAIYSVSKDDNIAVECREIIQNAII